MKSLIQLLIFSVLSLTVYSKSGIKANDTLLNFYNYFNEMISENKNPELSDVVLIYAVVDQNCIKEKLKMNQNGEKVINEHLAATLFNSVVHFCAKDPETIYDIEINKIVSSRMKDMRDKVECVKYILKLMEPEADLIKDFNPDEMKISKDQCDKEMAKHGYGKNIDLTEIDRKMDEVTCGIFNETKNRIFISKLFINKYGNFDEKKAIVENLKLKNYLKEIISKVYECDTEKIQSK